MMQLDPTPSNGGFITYKRRKHMPHSAPATSPNRTFPTQMSCLCSMLEDTGDIQLNYWKHVIEVLLPSLGPCKGGLRGCIEDVLAHVKGQDNKWKSFHHKIPVKGNLYMLRNETFPNGQVHDTDCKSRIVSSVIDHCQKSFIDVICSEKFVFLCKLLCENFEGIRTGALNFSVINSKLCNGDYDHSLEAFASDFQQVWLNLKRIGEEMASLADGLLKVSQTADEIQKTSQLGSSHTDLLISNPVKQSSSELSNVASKPEQVEACGLSRVSVCHNCGLQLDVRKALICDGCEAVHHVSCI